jgi:hypothetical protein
MKGTPGDEISGTGVEERADNPARERPGGRTGAARLGHRDSGKATNYDQVASGSHTASVLMIVAGVIITLGAAALFAYRRQNRAERPLLPPKQRIHEVLTAKAPQLRAPLREAGATEAG